MIMKINQHLQKKSKQMSNPELQIDIESNGNTTFVAPLGDVDLSKSSMLRSSLHDVVHSASEKIIIDLNAVPYMDSSGVATLIEALQLAKKIEKDLVLCNISQGVQSIIELSRLDMIFAIFESRESALGH